MARPSRRERRRTTLHCNECEHRFRGPAWFVTMESSDRGTLGWVPDRNGARGNKCPNCGSTAIGVAHD